MNKILSTSLAAIVGLVAASASAQGALNARAEYSQLACLSASELASLKTRYDGLKLDLPGSLCEAASPLAKLGKVLKALDSIALGPTATLVGQNAAVHKALKSPRDYLLSQLRTFKISEGQLVEAHKVRGFRDATLSPTFFRLSPIEAAVELLALVADSSRETYSVCWQGRYVNAKACEHVFKTGPQAGFGSARLLLFLNLARQGGPQHAEYRRLVTKAATLVSYIESADGFPVENLYVLGSNGLVYLVDPFFGTLERVALPYEGIGRIVKMKHNRKSGGLYLFTQAGQLWELDALRPAGEKPGVRRVDIPFAVKDYEPLTTFEFVPEIFNNVFFPIDVVVDTENRPWIVNDRVLGDKVDFDSKPPLPFDLKVLAGCWVGAQCLLDANGDQWSYTYQMGGLRKYDTTRHPEGLKWRFMTGGRDYREIYALDTQGALYMREGYDTDNFKLVWQFQTGSPTAFKFVEGLNFRAVLDGENRLFVHRGSTAFRVARDATTTYALEAGEGVRIVDFDYTRHVRFSKALDPWIGDDSAFRAKCGLERTMTNPWTERRVGLSAQGELVFEGAADQAPCQALPGKRFEAGSELWVRADMSVKVPSEAALWVVKPNGAGEEFVVPFFRN